MPRSYWNDGEALAAAESAADRFANAFRSLPAVGREDLMQQVLLDAWKNRRKYDPARGTFPNWVFGRACSRIRDLLTSEKAHHRRVQVLGHGCRISREEPSPTKPEIPALYRKAPAPRGRLQGDQWVWPWQATAAAEPPTRSQRRRRRRPRRELPIVMTPAGQWVWEWGFQRS